MIDPGSLIRTVRPLRHPYLWRQWPQFETVSCSRLSSRNSARWQRLQSASYGGSRYNHSSTFAEHAVMEPSMTSRDLEQNQSSEDDARFTEDQVLHIEQAVSSLSVVRYFRNKALENVQSGAPSSDQIREFYLHSNLKPPHFSEHLVSGALFGPDKLPMPPRLFIQSAPTCRVVAVFYIGSRLCGHPGYVHGGTLFALFDDVFARCAAMALPSGVGMTANLDINFRKPAIPNRLYVMRTEVQRQEGRKVWVKGSIRCLPSRPTDGLCQFAQPSTADDLSQEELGADLVAEASSLFIEPKFANVGAATFTRLEAALFPAPDDTKTNMALVHHSHVSKLLTFDALNRVLAGDGVRMKLFLDLGGNAIR